MTAPRGFLAGVACADIRGAGSARPDVALLVSKERAAAAGVFTRNRVKAAPVVVSQLHLRRGFARAIVVNSGNANACTGAQGLADALLMVQTTADAVDCSPQEVLVASTGVIGRELPLERVRQAILGAGQDLTPEGGPLAAAAIMTTDTRPKEASCHFQAAGISHRVGGMAKGAGMIHPDMATLLAFVTTDARLSPLALRGLLGRAVDLSLNTISIDGDTSTNDSCICLANGAARGPELTEGSEGLKRLGWALEEVLQALARQVVADGEGATRTFSVLVRGAETPEQALAAARTVTSSPLVKSAVHGADPNWGRVLMAVGRSGAELALDRCRLSMAGHLLFAQGRPTEVAPKTVAAALRRDHVQIEIDLGVGEAQARALGCDLSSDYVRINADYST